MTQAITNKITKQKNRREMSAEMAEEIRKEKLSFGAGIKRLQAETERQKEVEEIERKVKPIVKQFIKDCRKKGLTLGEFHVLAQLISWEYESAKKQAEKKILNDFFKEKKKIHSSRKGGRPHERRRGNQKRNAFFRYGGSNKDS